MYTVHMAGYYCRLWWRCVTYSSYYVTAPMLQKNVFALWVRLLGREDDEEVSKITSSKELPDPHMSGGLFSIYLDIVIRHAVEAGYWFYHCVVCVCARPRNK